AEICADGFGRVVAIALAPHYSRLSIGAYERALEEARGPLEVAMVRQWHDHPRFLDAAAERVRAALERFDPRERDRVALLFTAHSLPERITADGDPYVAQLEASVAGVLGRLGRTSERFAFQGAGRTPRSWAAASPDSRRRSSWPTAALQSRSSRDRADSEARSEPSAATGSSSRAAPRDSRPGARRFPSCAAGPGSAPT